ncbi:MAG: hypothetical protein U1B80_00905 [Anaerolineaceae bacterium]|nr:hypothetical protein [Anaerolineaceae bacterium]
MTLTRDLLEAIQNQYSLPLAGIHGIAHWARVVENGRILHLSLSKPTAARVIASRVLCWLRQYYAAKQSPIE